MELQQFLNSLPALSPADTLLIEKAYERAEQAHRGQKRKSGEPFFAHCLAVAQLLAEFRLDAATIAAGLLHDAVEDTKLTLEDIEREFGIEVARLVDGVTKMEHIPTQRSVKDHDKDAEFLRKTFLAMDDDVRIVLIKLADRLHNMRTLGYLPSERQVEVARETMDIFAPLANRLGIWRMKWELEDLAFRYINPVAYHDIAARLEDRRVEREAEVQRIADRLVHRLEEEGIKAKVTGRPKHIYSIYRKMLRKEVPYEEVYDVRALRVLVDDVPTCYRVLGIVHALWRPMQGEFDDYIAGPKDNFYQSLHTTVYDELGKPLEVQIRTLEMHNNAEYGIAAHWRYKEGAQRDDEAFEKRIGYFRRLMAFTEEEDAQDQSAAEFVDALKSEVFQDRVYAFTPKGDVVDLPMGATPIDFAYYIHTEIGNRCRGAKINGKLVGLDYKLRTGDRVEILTANRGGPSLDWLSPYLGYTSTTRARSKIRQWFRKQNRENNIAAGRVALDRELKRLGRADMSYDEVGGLFSMKADDFLATIGHGEINSGQIASRILEAERRVGRETLDRVLRQIGREDLTFEQVATLFVFSRSDDFLSAIGSGDITAEQIRDRIRTADAWQDEAAEIASVDASDGVEIAGGGNGLLINLARCCNPTPGDSIVGYITRGRGITVHRSDCKNILNIDEPNRLLPVNWRRTGVAHKSYPVPIMIVAYDREGLMRDIGGVIADEQISMSNVSITTKQKVATFLVTMEIVDVAQLTRVLNKIEKLPSVVEVYRRTAV